MTSNANTPKEKKFYEFTTTYINPRTSSKDEYFIQMKLEGNKLDFTAEKKNDISEIKYTSSSSFEELKQNRILNLFNSINEIYESILGFIKNNNESSENNQLIYIEKEGSLNLKIPINLGKIEEIYFELKAQEYTIEEKYKNLLDIVNDLRKRVKNLEMQNKENKEITAEKNNNENKGIKFKDSKIIKEDEGNMIKNWMINKDDFNTILLYRATRDGDTAEKICEKCEKKGPTIHVFKLTNGFRFGIYVQKDLLKESKIEDPSFFAFSLTNKKRYYPKNKESIYLQYLFKDYLFYSCCNGNIDVNNNCLNPNRIWINNEMLSNCNQEELCGLYKKDYATLSEYEVFQMKY